MMIMEPIFNLSVLNIQSSMASVPTAESCCDDNSSDYVFNLGPLRDPLTSVIPMTIIYVGLFISGLVGNVCTCVVITRNKHMRTATNYYLFSLAMSDLLLLIMGLPQELYQLWYKYPYVFGEAFCILRGFTSEMSTNASILTITCFTTERYLAICHPIRAHTMSKLSRAIKLIFTVWAIGGLCAVPLAIQFGLVVKEFDGRPVLDTAECTIRNPLQNAFEISTLCFFIVPMAVISVLYARIGMELRRSRDWTPEGSVVKDGQGRARFSLKKFHLSRLGAQQSNGSVRSHQGSSRKAVIKMLFAVVVAFFLCWAPFHCQRLIAIYVTNQTSTAVAVYTALTHISGVTYYVSATINPILYSIMSVKFREAFRDTLAHCCRPRPRYDRNSARYKSFRGSSLHRNGVTRNTASRRHEIRFSDLRSDSDGQFMTRLADQNEEVKRSSSFTALRTEAEIL